MNISEDAVRARSGETARWLVLNWHKLTDSALQEYLWAQFRGAALTAHEASSVSPDVGELERLMRGYQLECNECEQIAGKALGYPWYKDDQKNCPGATEADGVCVGEHVPSSVVAELARRYTELSAANSVSPDATSTTAADAQREATRGYMHHAASPPEPDALAVIEAARVGRIWMNLILEEINRKEGFGLSCYALAADLSFVDNALAAYDKAKRPTPAVAEDTEALCVAAEKGYEAVRYYQVLQHPVREVLAFIPRLIASLRKSAGT